MASLNANNQAITFCGIGAHHQNGIVERRIQTFTKISRTIFFHAQQYWPECVNTILCPFAVKADIERLNFLQLDMDGNKATAKFYNIKNINPNDHEYDTFGCPVYVLSSKLQSGSIGPPKWEPCSRVSVYLSHSPMHAEYVVPIPNHVIGNVSPQYNVVYYKTLSTVSQRYGWK